MSEDTTTARILDAALAYAGAGIPVIPAKPEGKAPLTEHGFHDATTDTAIIRGWWRRWPSANVAMPTGSRFDVLDVDVRSSGSGMPSYERLRLAGLLRGAVRIVRTPSTGLHVYFPTGGLASASLHDLHLDLKAAGGYVILPPSHVTTESYAGEYVTLAERLEGQPLDWAACVALLRPRRALPGVRSNGSGSIDALVRFVLTLPEGSRNKGLFWAANRAVEGGHNPLLLLDAALSSGLSEHEARLTIGSAVRKAVRS